MKSSWLTSMSMGVALSAGSCTAAALAGSRGLPPVPAPAWAARCRMQQGISCRSASYLVTDGVGGDDVAALC